MTKVSVIATNLNGKKFLPKLIETLHRQNGVETEIIIVDRESTDGSLEYLAGIPEATVFSEPARTGLAAGYALGLQHASHDLLFFCNEDMWFDSDCLQRLAAHIDLKRRVGSADPWQWTYDGDRLVHAGVRLERRWWYPNSSYPFRGFNFTVDLKEGDLIPFPCGGAFLIHRAVYEEIGGWDTSFFLESEDVDLFVRAWQRGWKCVTVPNAKVYHAVGAATAQKNPSGRPNSELRYSSGRSNLAAIAIKYFSVFPMLLGAGAAVFAPLAIHFFEGKWHYCKLDWAAIEETRRRLAALLKFRRDNRDLRRAKPGEQFFLDPEMQL